MEAHRLQKPSVFLVECRECLGRRRCTDTWRQSLTSRVRVISNAFRHPNRGQPSMGKVHRAHIVDVLLSSSRLLANETLLYHIVRGSTLSFFVACRNALPLQVGALDRISEALVETLVALCRRCTSCLFSSSRLTPAASPNGFERSSASIIHQLRVNSYRRTRPCAIQVKAR